MSLFDDVKKNLIEWYNVTSEKTTEVARVTTRRYDKFGISRDIERQFSELGSLVYNGLKEGREDILADDGVQALVERITELETELRDKDAEIERIRREYAERKAEAAAEADEAPAGSAGAAAGVDETVMKDPALGPGGAQSAILIEPTDVALTEPLDPDIVEEAGPEKHG